MNGNDLIRAGYTSGRALEAAKAARKTGRENKTIREELIVLLATPEQHESDPLYGEVAQELLRERRVSDSYNLDTVAPYHVWGKDQIEPGAIEQMDRAARLPIAVRGALMPDAHVGYGLPIGGVLATENSVIPYAVGVDIACRMRMTIFDVSPIVLDQKRDKFRKMIEGNTLFGTGKTWEQPADHAVMADSTWNQIPFLKALKPTAWKQLGTSGSGNHFVEFGTLDVTQPIAQAGATIQPGSYLALLSHSGSRRLGAEIANRYTEIAMEKRARLPKDFLHLAWLDLNEEAGAEYWAAMTLAGRYASANHQVIHEKIIDAARFEVLGTIENHHNFAWASRIDGKDVIVHRKGATPADAGVLGIIPGSMSAPGYVVRGLGNVESLNSAAHGAGRRMSRSQANKTFEWGDVKRKLKSEGVDLISAGLDESPGAYKDIREVMAHQNDLVEPLAEFHPKLVKMDGGGGKAED